MVSDSVSDPLIVTALRGADPQGGWGLCHVPASHYILKHHERSLLLVRLRGLQTRGAQALARALKGNKWARRRLSAWHCLGMDNHYCDSLNVNRGAARVLCAVCVHNRQYSCVPLRSTAWMPMPSLPSLPPPARAPMPTHVLPYVPWYTSTGEGRPPSATGQEKDPRPQGPHL